MIKCKCFVPKPVVVDSITVRLQEGGYLETYYIYQCTRCKERCSGNTDD